MKKVENLLIRNVIGFICILLSGFLFIFDPIKLIANNFIIDSFHVTIYVGFAYIGLVLASRKKITILFLRKFNDVDSIKLIGSLSKKMKHSYRIISLSTNGDLQPRYHEKVNVGLGCLFQIAWIFGAINGFFFWAKYSPNVSILTNYQAFLSILLFLLAARAFLKGNSNKNLLVRDKHELAKLEIYAKKFKTRSFALTGSAPYLTSIRVIDQYWKDVVLNLMEISDLVIAEITYYSKNIEWEVEHLKMVEKKLLIYNKHSVSRPTFDDESIPIYGYETERDLSNLIQSQLDVILTISKK